jgi:hypothetical protein
MLNGKKELVDRFIKWLETRTFYLPFKNPDMRPNGPKDKDGKLLKEGFLPVDGGLRYGLFGTWEFVFPENHMNEVLTTLKFDELPGRVGEGFLKILTTAKRKSKRLAIRKAFELKPIPKFKKDNALLMPEDLRKNINIVPLGVRYDKIRKFEDKTLFNETGLIFEAL